MIQRRTYVEHIDCAHVRDYNQFMTFLRGLRSKVNFGIIPLRDTKFNRSKSNLKLLEMAALGLKCVVSNMPVYMSFPVLQNSIIFTENSVDAWTEALEAMIKTIQLGKTNISQNLINYCAENYVLTENYCKVLDKSIKRVLKLTNKGIVR